MLQNLPMLQAWTQQSTQKVSLPKRPLEVQINDLMSTAKILNQEKLSQQDDIESKLEIALGHKILNAHGNELQKKTKLKHLKAPRCSSYRIHYPFNLQQFQSQRGSKRQHLEQIHRDPQVQREEVSELENYNIYRQKKRYSYLMDDPFLSPVQLSQKIREDYEQMIEKKVDKSERERKEVINLKPKFTKQSEEVLIYPRKRQERRMTVNENLRDCQNKTKTRMEMGKRHAKHMMPYLKRERDTQNTGRQQAIG